MKKLLTIASVVALIAMMANAEATVLYQDDFESYTTGNTMIGVSGWTRAYGGDADGVCEVREDGGNKYAYFKGTGLFGIHIPVDNVGGQSATKNYKLSFKVMRPSSVGGDIICGSNDGLGESHFCLRDGGTTFVYNGDAISPNPGVTENCPIGTWTDFSIEFNTDSNNCRVQTVEFNGGVYAKLNAVMGNGHRNDYTDKFPNLRIFIWGGSAELCIDDIDFQLVDKPATPIVNVSGTEGVVRFSSLDPIAQTLSVSGADVTVSAAIESGSDWLSFDDDTFAKDVELTVGTPSTVNFKVFGVDPLAPTMKAAKISYSYNDGDDDLTISKLVFLQTGCDNKGYCLVFDDFNMHELGKDVKEIPCLWGDSASGVGTVVDDPLNPGNKCMKVTGFSNVHAYVNMPTQIYPDFDVKVSAKVYYPDGGGCWIGTDMGHKMGEHSFGLNANGNFTFNKCSGGSINVECTPGWTEFLYTFAIGRNGSDARPWVLKHVQVGNEKFYVDEEYDPGCGDNIEYFDCWRWYNHTTSVYIDDLNVSMVPAGQVPEPAILGLLALAGLFFTRKQR